MLTSSTLKNVQIQDFEEFFKKHKVQKWSARIDSFSDSYLKHGKIRDLISEELQNNSSFTVDELDGFLWEALYYSNFNYHLVYQFNEIFINDVLSASDIDLYLKQHTEINYNKLICDWDDEEGISLVSTRMEMYDNGKVKALHLLIKVDTLNMRYEKTHMFCGVTIDVKNKILLIKFAQRQYEEIDLQPMKLQELIVETLKGLGNKGKQFTSLDLNIIQLNRDKVTSTIYQLFAELSREAEELLDKRVTAETEKMILDFMHNIKLSSIKEEYTEQIKAVIYQDISDTMEDQIFKKGWIFNFKFREGDYTKASSRVDKNLPVYSAKSFWQLKELIHKEKRMEEAGFHWNINENAGDGDFVEVRAESKNSIMILHYYHGMRVRRKEKEEYVIRKVSKYLCGD